MIGEKGTMGLDANTKAVMRDIVDGLVDNNKMFSGYHVALIASDERGCGVPRRVMKEEVHEYYTDGGLGHEYTRTWQDDGQGVSYYVYHHRNDDPRLYQPLDRSGPELKLDKVVDNSNDVQLDQAVGAFVAPVNDVATVDEADEADEAEADEESEDDEEDEEKPKLVKNLDEWGRIRLPSRALKEVGIAAGEPIFVGIDSMGKALVVSKNQLNSQDSPSGQFSKVYSYRTDCYCSVRIGKNRLIKAGINGNSVEIEVNAEQVVISTQD